MTSRLVKDVRATTAPYYGSWLTVGRGPCQWAHSSGNEWRAMLRMDGGHGSYRAENKGFPIQATFLNGHLSSTLKEAAKDSFIMLARVLLYLHFCTGKTIQLSITMSRRMMLKHNALWVTKSHQVDRVKKWPLNPRKWMSNTSDLTALLIISHQQQRQMSEITTGDLKSIFLLLPWCCLV